MRSAALFLTIVLAGAAQQALAADCPSTNICASQPEGIVAALQTQGYKASLGKADSGKPKIASAASGYNYDIFFYDCKETVDCTSLNFKVWFNKEDGNSVDLVNKWNMDKRFAVMAFDPTDGMISLSYDISTVGGLNQVNFADTVEWWDTMLGQVSKFMDENRPKKKS